MANKKLKKSIKKCKRNLEWNVKTTTGPDVKTLKIATDYEKKVHNIFIPETDVRDIEFLHEIGHATLSETINPLFSGALVVNAPSKQTIYTEIQPATRAANDWFVDHWLYKIHPEEEKKEIEEHYRMLLKHSKNKNSENAEIFLGSALMIAQAEKYLKIKTETNEQLKLAINSFININPDHPTVGKLETLVNALLGTYSQFRVKRHIIQNGGCWKIL